MPERQDPRARHGYHPLTVKAVRQETPDTCSIVLDIPDHLRDDFAYRPGQFCTFRVRSGDDEVARCYSMSSAPEVDDDLGVEPLPDDVEVPEADALDQRRPLTSPLGGAAEIPDGVNEADALDQARVVDGSDDDELRDPL